MLVTFLEFIFGTRKYNRLVNMEKKKTNINCNIFISCPHFYCLEDLTDPMYLFIIS